VVQNGVETNLFDPHRQGPNVKRNLGLAGKFVVSYIGTMGIAHGLEKVLESAAQLRQSNPEIQFLFVGEGANKQKIISLARSTKLKNVRFVDEQARERIPDYIAASDICLVLLKNSEVFKTVIPTKMLEFMSCARPVILGVDGQARKILEEAEAGLFVRPENAGDLTAAILKLAANPELRTELGRNGRKFILQYFSRPQTARAYMQFLESFVKKETRAIAA
jgi:glycosyltransferase involved in cell wall biosynthesis